MGEAVEHEADRGQGDHCLGDLGQRLVVLGQPTPSAEPAERSFDHPAARLHDKAGGACGAANDDQRQTRQIAGEPGRKPIVDAVSEHGPEPGVERFQALQQVAEAIGILNVGRMYEDAEQQPVRVHRDVPLAPLQPLGGVPTARAAALRGLHALGVDDGCGGTGFPPGALAQHDHEVVANALPHPVSQEGAHIAVHGAPGREGRRRRQMPPLAASRFLARAAVSANPAPPPPAARTAQRREPSGLRATLTCMEVTEDVVGRWATSECRARTSLRCGQRPNG